MSISHFSAFKITDSNNLPFSPDMYSRFKYGSKNAARQMGKLLAYQFIHSKEYEWYKKCCNKPLVVLPSPYCFIPTATYALKDYFIPYVNMDLINNNLRPIQECKIFREYSYHSDYGAMSTEDRKKAISSDTFHVDSAFLRGKVSIYLDDIRITGAHEERVTDLIHREKLENETNIFMYFAELTNSQIAPQLENYLNFFSINSLLDINKIIVNENFLFNTRSVKYILNAPHVEFVNFIQYQREVFIDTLFHYATANCYHLEPAFKTNFDYLKTLIDA